MRKKVSLQNQVKDWLDFECGQIIKNGIDDVRCLGAKQVGPTLNEHANSEQRQNIFSFVQLLFS